MNSSDKIAFEPGDHEFLSEFHGLSLFILKSKGPSLNSNDAAITIISDDKILRLLDLSSRMTHCISCDTQSWPFYCEFLVLLSCLKNLFNNLTSLSVHSCCFKDEHLIKLCTCLITASHHREQMVSFSARTTLGFVFVQLAVSLPQLFHNFLCKFPFQELVINNQSSVVTRAEVIVEMLKACNTCDCGDEINMKLVAVSTEFFIVSSKLLSQPGVLYSHLRAILALLAIDDSLETKVKLLSHINLLSDFRRALHDSTIRLLYFKVIKSLLPDARSGANQPQVMQDFSTNVLTTFNQHGVLLKDLGGKLSLSKSYFGGRTFTSSVGKNYLVKREIVQLINAVFRSVLTLLRECNTPTQILNDVAESVIRLIATTHHDDEDWPEVATLHEDHGDKMALTSHDGDHYANLIDLFVEQDDELVEMLLLHLSISQISTRNWLGLCPHLMFVHFVRSILFDSSVMLDLLTSNETDFLFYLLRYMKQANPNLIQPTSSTLKSLSISIKKLNCKKLFPYNPVPLLRHINVVLTQHGICNIQS